MRKKQWLSITTLCAIVGLTNAQDLNANDRIYTTERSQYNPRDPSPYTPDPYRPPQSGRNDPFGGPDQRDPYGKSDQYGNDPPYGRNDGKFDNRPMYRPQDNNYNQLNPYEHMSIIKESTYFVVASQMVRPGQLYRVAVTILEEKSPNPLFVRAAIQRNGVEVSADKKPVKKGIPETLLMKVPTTSAPGEYRLRVEGLYENALGGGIFANESKLIFSQRSMTIFIQLDKPVYMQGQTVHFRTIPINTELKAFDNAIDVYMLDPNGHIMKRWLSRQSNLGTVSLQYQLSDLPIFGDWKVRVVAQGQIEEATFSVEEYYQTRFEVNVTMPAFFFTTEEYIYGTVMANYTSGAPVRGNLTLRATIRPIKPLQQRVDEINRKLRRPRPDDPNRDEYIDYDQQGSYNRPNAEIYFNFDEEVPFWYTVADTIYERVPPHLRFFYGSYNFKYPIRDLLHHVPSLQDMEIVITATVGERFLNEIIEGYSIARVFNSSIKLAFLGDSPQVFKPGMPITAYIVASFHDGSPLPEPRLYSGQMEVRTSVELRGGARRELPTHVLKMSENPGVWQYNVDLRDDLQIDGPRDFEQLNEISSLKIEAYFRDAFNERASAELLMLTHYSPENKHIKISTSTRTPKVGEYIILHVRSNYYVDRFNYLIISKGIVLLTGDEVMEDSVATMAITLSAEMAPVTTVVVWHVGKYGDVTADSLTFPVNGISRNKFSVFINNKKARTGHKVEVAIYGEPGSYVALSGIDNAFYTMQAGNELTYAKVITKMASFDEHTNGTQQHTWFSHKGDPDELVYFPASTYGIDANRTFAFAGLIVFSDVEVARRPNFCNDSMGYSECLNGQCYRHYKRCDGFIDCDDGTDESGCNRNNYTELSYFRKYRFNRIQRQYDNVWLWRDCNIGPHGRYIFNVPVPARPAHWMVSAFSMSPTLGFGMIKKPIEYVGVLPFFINVEMPKLSMQGEQIGIRVSVFNYMLDALEATVVLNGSPDYKFVHVEENGVVVAYNPRTSFGEHQFFIYIKAQDVAVVYIPIVPTRLGDIDVTIHATTLIGKDQITKTIRIEADGIPQYRHQSMLLDLSNRAYAFQYMHVNVTETPIIPYEYDRYYVYGSNKATVSIVGDVVGAVFPTMPLNATSLLNLPMESAEQNIFGFAANMYTTLYMRYAIMRNRTLEKQAFYYMNIGYQRQLSFMQTDGSFSLFRSDWNQSASSVWLTSYCARILQEASFYEWENYIYIDPVVIAKSVEWVLKHQTPDGSFYETTWSPDRKYNNTIKWPTNDPIQQRNITLTAHVLIMLEAVKDLTSGLSAKVSIAQKNAVNWLERNMKLLELHGKSFDVAIVAFALMKSKARNAESAFTILTKHMQSEGGLIYWAREHLPQPPYKIENQKPFLLPRLPYKYDSENIEATAYGLMVSVARQEVYVDNIVRWLNTQRLTDGGWASTMDTAHAMKALIEYTSVQRLRDISSLTVTIEATALPGKSRVLHVNNKNRGQLQSIHIPEAWGTVKVQAKGTGYAILQMSVQYNVDIARFQTQPPLKAFDLTTRAEFYGRNHSHIDYFSCQRWSNLNESERSGLAVLDITIPTGYIIQQQKLDAYILSRQVRNLQRAKFLERKVLFYFDYLDREEICLNLTVERWYPVANMSKYLPIRVYDYYAPERFNETIFDAFTTYLLNICEVCGSSQCPYCYIYNTAIKLPVPLLTLFTTSLILVVKYVWSRDEVII